MKKFKNINEDHKNNRTFLNKINKNLTVLIGSTLAIALSFALLVISAIEHKDDSRDDNQIIETTTSTTSQIVETTTILTTTRHYITSTTTTTMSSITTTSTKDVTTTMTTNTTNTSSCTSNTTTTIIESDITTTDTEEMPLATDNDYQSTLRCVCEPEETIITEVYECTVTYEESTEPTYEEYIVFKPSTHYVHKSTCRWFDDSCYEISSTDGIEARLCDECNPDMEIISLYEESNNNSYYSSDNGYPIGSDGLPHAALNYVTEEERIYLCNTVAQEYGCDWISQYDKALVVAVVMNRLNDGGWQGSGRENTIYNILTAPYQFDPAYAVPYYRYNVTDSCITAVDYYFENMNSFPHYTSFYGDGSVNYFS